MRKKEVSTESQEKMARIGHKILEECECLARLAILNKNS